MIEPKDPDLFTMDEAVELAIKILQDYYEGNPPS